jgi:hypothetical protein
MSTEDQASQDAAAAAWRAARSQKSCLHSDKPDEKKVRYGLILHIHAQTMRLYRFLHEASHHERAEKGFAFSNLL